MRLGGPVSSDYSSPEEWVALVKAKGYRAVYCPVPADAVDKVVEDYRRAAADADIVIAETGAWSNPLSPDETEAKEAVKKCKQQLALAERAGARCCVNISGSRGEKWDGPHELNLTKETFDRIVETVRGIIDDVKPERAFYALETMPWMYPDSVASYVDLLKAVDRKQFGVHFDAVNLVCSPQRYYGNAAMIHEAVEKLGPFMRSCHAKDIRLGDGLTTHLDEVRPGLGKLDYRTLLKELDKLDADLPLMLEHLPDMDEYDAAAKHIRGVAEEVGVAL